MTSSKRIHKDSIKELYHEMKKRIRIILNLLNSVSPDKPNPLPDEKSFQTISNLINSIMSSAQFEPDNQYREAIVEISNWLNAAFHKEYLNTNANSYPNPLFVVRKGCEILHSFFHRDLRRKQLTSEEHEIFRNFVSLINSLPDPQKNKLDQSEVDNMIEELLKSS